MDLLGVEQLLGQPVRELSLGERMKMELIAALLHSPDILFLDEPTIGLDVIAQYNIQKFLKYYQQQRKITILLTSHYMKDITALCQRVVVIANGQMHYDGSLSGIIDEFGGHKNLTLQFPEGIDTAPDLSRYGTVLEVQMPRVRLQVPRREVGQVLSDILSKHPVDDVSVEDPPLEEIIASVFSIASDKHDQTQQVTP